MPSIQEIGQKINVWWLSNVEDSFKKKNLETYNSMCSKILQKMTISDIPLRLFSFDNFAK